FADARKIQGRRDDGVQTVDVEHGEPGSGGDGSVGSGVGQAPESHPHEEPSERTAHTVFLHHVQERVAAALPRADREVRSYPSPFMVRADRFWEPGSVAV